MKRILSILILPLLAMTSMLNAVTKKEEMPPLIDREIFFGNPEIMAGQLSPDGKWISFIKPYKGVRNIWVKKADEPFEKAKPVTASQKRPIPNYFWSRDSKYILYVQDKDGDENFHVYALDPMAEVAEGMDVPEARNLTNLNGVRARIHRLPKTDPDLIYVGLNDRDKRWHDLYKVRISTGEKELIRKNLDQISSWFFDNNDELRMASKQTMAGDTLILTIEGDTFKPVYECNVFESAYLRKFHKDNEMVYIVSNKGDRNLTELLLLDPKTGETEKVESDPEGKVDFGFAWFSDVTDELIATGYTLDKTRYLFKDKAWEEDFNWISSEFPGMEVSFGSGTDDERQLLVHVKSDMDPSSTYLVDRDAKTITFQYRPRPKMPLEHLVPLEPISYKSSDGLEIRGYLALPKGLKAKKLPLIVVPHGGPWARDYWGYDSYAQFWANRGYAVFMMNFRGSTGFGKAFLNAGNDQWGDLMQDDITYGVKYLIEKGIVDKKRVGIMGGSYGGYATLAGMAFTPEVYAAGVSIVGPSNLLTLLEAIPPYWESFRKTLYVRVGDPTIPEEKERLKRQSPLNSAKKIQAPLMIVQGKNDPRVAEAESEQIVVAMRELGLPVEYINADDEGHGFRRPVNNMAMLAASEKFFAKHLGGRYQKSMPEDVEARLKEITMDVSKVEYETQ